MALAEGMTHSETIGTSRLLDRTAALDALVIEFREGLNDDRLPTAAQDKQMIIGIRNGNLTDAKQLVRSYRGLVATLVHQSKEHIGAADGEQMLRLGTRGLIKAALLHDVRNGQEFSDTAVVTVEGIIGLQHRTSGGKSHISEIRPTDRLANYVNSLAVIEPIPPSVEETFEAFSPDERIVAQFIHLPYSKISELLGVTDDPKNEKLNMHLNKIKQKLGLAHLKGTGMRATQIALEMRRRGYQLPIETPDKPLHEIFTNQELDAGGLLGLPYSEIESKVGFPANEGKRKVYEMRKKIGASTNAELALIIASFDDGTRNEGSYNGEMTKLERFAKKIGLASVDGIDKEALLGATNSTQQRRAVELYFYDENSTWYTVGAELGISHESALASAKKGISHIRKQFGD